ncbi:MAG: hypothetical protein A2010_13225 [Nitrospirae bacterium GWD2_57_9]|nr:MAG: hypothetical protein A2010_13225 [Nitrospirae bacterium GWD2_57_9]OGW46777.1 MAG: hypothetical protein A2078_08100 [Nitrospirae bacterium GWC2_57_9]
MAGILVLTAKGSDALKNTPPDLSPICRNILVQVDGKKSIEDIQTMFRGLKGLEDAIQKLLAGNFVETSRQCKDLVKAIAQEMLGAKAPTLLKKIDDLHAKYGEQCWEHVDEIEKLARLFYGEVTADQLKTEIAKIVRETKK